ncbi:MAG: hypothetical protein K2Y40_10225 [Reyranella sp.]|nr:hypothetical protein [Reyranella sp.]
MFTTFAIASELGGVVPPRNCARSWLRVVTLPGSKPGGGGGKAPCAAGGGAGGRATFWIGPAP